MEVLAAGSSIHILATATSCPEPEQTILLAIEDISTQKRPNLRCAMPNAARMSSSPSFRTS
jgi:hypothetical protein